MEQEKEGLWSGEEKDTRHQWETVVRALTRTRNPLAETEGASLSQQIQMWREEMPRRLFCYGWLFGRQEGEQGQTLGGLHYTLGSISESPAQYCSTPGAIPFHPEDHYSYLIFVQIESTIIWLLHLY